MYHLSSITDLFDSTNLEVIVTTQGKDGSIFYTKEERDGVSVKAYTMFEKVDTTGCGDAYISGFLFGYANHYPIKECCILGYVLSSFVISQMGCCSALPTKEQLLTAYNSITSGGTR